MWRKATTRQRGKDEYLLACMVDTLGHSTCSNHRRIRQQALFSLRSLWLQKSPYMLVTLETSQSSIGPYTSVAAEESSNQASTAT